MDSGKIDRLRHIISSALEKPLPGINSQYRMAPLGRENVIPGKNKKEASVLILIYPKKNSLYTVFIRRNNYDGPHSGQISFPGGRYDKNDNLLENTAIRETYEEIGVKLDASDLLGKLTPLYIPVSNFYVIPYLATLSSPPLFNIDPHEVQYLIEYPLKELVSENNQKNMEVIMDMQKKKVPCYNLSGNQIWGATAMILSEFIDLLKNSESNFNSLL